MHSISKFLALLLVGALTLKASSALARDFRTAEVAMAAAQPATEATKDAPSGVRFDLTQPLPVHFLGGMVTLEANAIREGTQMTGRSRSGFGMQYLHHAAEGMPQFRLELQRLGAAGQTKAKPLTESRVYFDASDADHGWIPSPGGFRTKLAVGVRDLRQGETSLALHPIASFQFERKRRILFHVEAPTSVLLSFTGGSSRQWTVFSQATNTRPYFVISEQDDPWHSTRQSSASIGLRHRLFSQWYVALQAGHLKREGYLNYQGPWAELAMQSWTSLP